MIEVGTPVIVRASAAGVHAGKFASRDGSTVTLTEARRLWRWTCAKGDFLSGVARHGLDHSRSKIGGAVATQVVIDACEVIQCSPEAAASIATAPEFRGE